MKKLYRNTINNEKIIDGTDSNQMKFVYTDMASTVEDEVG